jgi:hypothetical protein
VHSTRPSGERRGRSSRVIGGDLVHGACWLRYAARLPLHRRCTTGTNWVELKWERVQHIRAAAYGPWLHRKTPLATYAVSEQQSSSTPVGGRHAQLADWRVCGVARVGCSGQKHAVHGAIHAHRRRQPPGAAPAHFRRRGELGAGGAGGWVAEWTKEGEEW